MNTMGRAESRPGEQQRERRQQPGRGQHRGDHGNGPEHPSGPPQALAGLLPAGARPLALPARRWSAPGERGSLLAGAGLALSLAARARLPARRVARLRAGQPCALSRFRPCPAWRRPRGAAGSGGAVASRRRRASRQAPRRFLRLRARRRPWRRSVFTAPSGRPSAPEALAVSSVFSFAWESVTLASSASVAPLARGPRRTNPQYGLRPPRPATMPHARGCRKGTPGAHRSVQTGASPARREGSAWLLGRERRCPRTLDQGVRGPQGTQEGTRVAHALR